MRLRTATPDDLDDVVALTRSRRRRLAEWSPVYFNPSVHADDGHAGFLAFLLGSDDHDTRVFVDDDNEVIGFLQLVDQPTHTWVDDLCVATDDLWPQAIGHLATVGPPWVTCVSAHDVALADALTLAYVRTVSTFHSRLLVDPPPGHGAGDAAESATAPASPPAHTFGGRPMDPAAPGGPTCVVDRIEGADRSWLLRAAMGDAAGRGDAQMIVVCDARDTELQRMLVALGFTAQVDLFRADSL